MSVVRNPLTIGGVETGMYHWWVPLGGVTASGAPAAVQVGAGGNLTSAYNASVSTTRPSNATAYTAEDVIGAADVTTPANAGNAIWTFASIGPTAGAIRILSAQLTIGATSVPAGMTTMALELFTASPTAILDNAAYSINSADVLKYVGTIALGTPAVKGAQLLYTSVDTLNKIVTLAAASTSLYGILKTAGGFTPASGTVFTVRLNTEAL